jgi:hypothetical protein
MIPRILLFFLLLSYVGDAVSESIMAPRVGGWAGPDALAGLACW